MFHEKFKETNLIGGFFFYKFGQNKEVWTKPK
jgi:hypothetical protein